MSRKAARRRWLMSGPWPHPKTGILYYRKVTPPELFSSRLRLAEMGVTVTREVQRSLGTRDRRPAERRYVEVSREVEAMWDRWRALLEHGPVTLSHREEVALAAERAQALLDAHEDNPFEAPPEHDVRHVLFGDGGSVPAVLAAMPEKAQRQLHSDLVAYLSASEEERGRLVFPLLERHPQFKAIVGADLAASLEGAYGTESDAALAAHGLNIRLGSRNLLNLQMARLMAAAWRGLEARRSGDYRAVSELDAAPRWQRSPAHSDNKRGLSLFKLLDHKAASQSMKPKTVRDIRAYVTKLADFVGHEDARRIAKDDIRRWRDSLTACGDLSPKTVNGRYLSAVSSVLAHGVREFDLPANVAAGIRDNRAIEPPIGSKGYSEEQAATILKATFAGSAKALSEPHQKAIRWVPWILAYTGLRVVEVTQFQARNLREEGGIPFLLITPEDGSTKSGKAWAVGIHRHLIELGLLDFLRGSGTGPVFYEAYPAGTDLKALGGRHRAQESAGRVSKWITSELGIEAPLGRPNHAWRHLFTTRSRACGMDKEARDFMLGSRSATDAREGYGDWPPAVLDREINKLPRF